MRTSVKGVVVAAVVALATGCSSSSSGSTAATTGTGQAVATTSTSPTPTAATWTAEQLKPALLTLKDLPAGYKVDPDAEDNTPGEITSKDAGCATLVKIMNANQPTGTLAFAKTGWAGGQQGPFVGEELDGMPTAQVAQASLAELAEGAKTCRTIQMDPESPGRVSVVPAPQVGDKAIAFRVDITAGPGKGVSMNVVGVATGRIIVGMTFGMADSATMNAVTKLAVQKAKATLHE